MFIVKFFLASVLEEIVQIFVQNFNVELIFLDIGVVMITELHALFVRQLAHSIAKFIIVLLILISPISFEDFQKLGLNVPPSNTHSLRSLFSLQNVVLVNELNEVSSDNLEHVLAWRLLLLWYSLLFVPVYKFDWRVLGLWILFDYLKLRYLKSGSCWVFFYFQG